MKEGTKIDYDIYTLGTSIVKFNLPMEFIDSINKAYDENSENLKPYNDYLAGKIADEKLVDEILTDEMQESFLWCFQEYLNIIDYQIRYQPVLTKPWINEMKSGEYNPIHYHLSADSDIGLSSVLMLKRPDWYGGEASREEAPTNGWLEFTGGDQATLSKSQTRYDAQVGEFYVFPFTLLHAVYPFNSTAEVRRTLSYNCNLIRQEK
jgi:hypothetical protein|tara:strand:- start:428 stop:1048 length:621 start_codon:yes stop_codon:yes gene_type:complete